MKPIRDNGDFKEAVKCPKRTKFDKIMIVKGQSSHVSLFSRFGERLNAFWTLNISGYLMDPTRDNEDFKT